MHHRDLDAAAERPAPPRFVRVHLRVKDHRFGSEIETDVIEQRFQIIGTLQVESLQCSWEWRLKPVQRWAQANERALAGLEEIPDRRDLLVTNPVQAGG